LSKRERETVGKKDTVVAGAKTNIISCKETKCLQKTQRTPWNIMQQHRKPQQGCDQSKRQCM